MIANNPVGEIEISGGTFVGGTGGSAISGSDSVLNGERNWWGGYEVEPLSTHNIIANNYGCVDANDNAICTSGNKQVGGSPYANVYLNATIYINGSNSGNFNSLGTIVVRSTSQTN